jgi:LysR family transcriptional regulator, regulator for bpeEF and oprC
VDKLRALHYFVAAAQQRSLSGAARHLEVSVPAVSKLVAALERELAVKLFDRGAKGLTLTAQGQTYFELCRPLVEQLGAAEQAVKGDLANARGTLVVAAPHAIARHCLLPALQRFHDHYPDLQLDLRDVDRPSQFDARSVDVFVQWRSIEPNTDLVQRQVGQSRFLVCASPSYWTARGIPQSPRDLEGHACLLYRTAHGTVHDLWPFERGGSKQPVAARGWLLSSHRDVLLDAALAGVGVARLTDFTIRGPVREGRLVPVLRDWEMRDAPQVDVLYASSQRRVQRVRAFVAFAEQLFREIEASCGERAGQPLVAERPRWWARPGRASAAVTRNG